MKLRSVPFHTFIDEIVNGDCVAVIMCRVEATSSGDAPLSCHSVTGCGG